MPNGNDCNIFIRLDFVRPKFYIKSLLCMGVLKMDFAF